MNRVAVILGSVVVVALAAGGGYWFGARGHAKVGGDTTATSATTGDARKPAYWQAPMDPNYRSDKPGKSPMGMDLIPVYADASGSANASDVTIAPAVVANLGVRTVEVESGSQSNRIEAVGSVGYDQDSITTISTRAEGWIEKLAVKSVGESIHRGQLLYELYSPKLATSAREFQIALASGRPSLIAASRARMHALGFTSGQIASLAKTGKLAERVAQRADIDAVVVDLGVTEGAYVMPATPIMKLASLESVWLMVEIGERDAAQLRKGQEAVAEFDAFPGQRWPATVDIVYPDINPTTRTAKLRLRIANPDLKLQPNMYARVSIASTPRNDVITIPALAVIRTGDSDRVVVALGDGRFDVCPIETGARTGNRVEVLRGLRAGQRVVTSAQFLIDSEANVDAAALRLGAGKSDCTTMPPMSQTKSTAKPANAADEKPQ